MAITLSILDRFAKFCHRCKTAINFQQNPYWVTHHTLSMLLHYLGKLKNQKFALCMHVKHVSSVIFYHLSQQISAKRHENKCKDKHCAKYQHFTFYSFTVLNELKERLIAVLSDVRQDIIDTAVDQCRKCLQACVRANGGHLNTFCEQTLANNLHF